MHASKEHDKLLPLAPAFVQRTGFLAWWQNFGAQRRGRKDARQDPDAQGHHPWSRSLFHEVDQVGAAVDAAFHEVVEKIDMQITGAITTRRAALSRREVSQASLDDHVYALASLGNPSSIEAKSHLVEMSRLQAAILQCQQQIASADREQMEGISRRHHVHEAASAILDSWQSRANQLAALHRRGFVARRGRAALEYPLAVCSEPSYLWSNGQKLPFPGGPIDEGLEAKPMSV